MNEKVVFFLFSGMAAVGAGCALSLGLRAFVSVYAIYDCARVTCTFNLFVYTFVADICTVRGCVYP